MLFRSASCYLRPLTWIGDKKLGVSPRGNTIHLMVAAWAWGAYLGEDSFINFIFNNIFCQFRFFKIFKYDVYTASLVLTKSCLLYKITEPIRICKIHKNSYKYCFFLYNKIFHKILSYRINKFSLT